MKDNFTFGLEKVSDNLYTNGAFFSVGDKKESNTMRISWGAVGFMWKKPVFIAMIRESRYTSKFLELGKSFTISVPFGDNMYDALVVSGSTSGRDTDKEKVGHFKFASSKKVDAKVIEGCDRYYECKIVLKQPVAFDECDEDIKKNFYPENETNHIFIFGEIVQEY